MSDNFGVVTFDDRGPIKQWQRLAAIEAHNNRTISEPHCDPDGPKPLHLIGHGNLVADTKARLLASALNPANLRKNVALAYEVVLSASHAYFEAETQVEKDDRLAAFVLAALAFVKRAWKRVQIISMVLHQDEHTPHIHVVLLPLIEKIYKRWPERGKAWALVGRSIVGPGEYQRVHNLYAECMAPLGLKRGVSRSRAKYRPYAAELRELEAARVKAEQAAEDSARLARQVQEEAEQSRVRWQAEFDRQQQIRAELDERQTALDARETEVKRKEGKYASSIVKLVAQQREAAIELKALKETAAALDSTVDHALAFRMGLLTMPLSSLPHEALDALRTIADFQRAAELIALPDEATNVLPVDLQQQFGRISQVGR